MALIRSLALVVCVSFCAQGTWADGYTPADQVKISTPVYQPALGEFKPMTGTYHYTVAWQGIPAADVSVSCSMSEGMYRVVAEAKTYSGIDIFYKLRYRAEGTLSASSLTPVSTFIEQQENSRRKVTRINFLDTGEVEAFRQTIGKQPATLRFTPNNNMMDPFAAAFLARSLHWSEGETKEFDTFNGKTRYLISLTAAEKVQMKVNGEHRDVWVIIPKVKNLTNAERSKKLRSAKIYVTADEKREVLQIVSSVFIGSVTTTLDSFSPVASPSPLTMAQHRTEVTIR